MLGAAYPGLRERGWTLLTRNWIGYFLAMAVVNEAEHNRAVLANEHVRYAEPTPHALAAALSAVVRTPDFGALAAAASASVSTRSWAEAGQQLEKVLRRALST